MGGNYVELIGEVVANPEHSHEAFGEDYYRFYVRISRQSGVFDTIPVMASERLFDMEQDYVGERFRIIGDYRSHNEHQQDGRTKLVLYVFANEVYTTEESDLNHINLVGFICKPTVYRETASGRRITDILIAVPRGSRRSDFIPCICWGRNAFEVARMSVGERIEVWGRVQSRAYRVSHPTPSERVAYEISVSEFA